MDSGIVVGGSMRDRRGSSSQISLHSAGNFSSKNYEWLRVVASRLIAFHVCHLYSASACSIPEFVKNIVALMCASPLLKPYMEKICSDEKLYALATGESESLEACFKVVFFQRKTLQGEKM